MLRGACRQSAAVYHSASSRCCMVVCRCQTCTLLSLYASAASSTCICTGFGGVCCDQGGKRAPAGCQACALLAAQQWCLIDGALRMCCGRSSAAHVAALDCVHCDLLAAVLVPTRFWCMQLCMLQGCRRPDSCVRRQSVRRLRSVLPLMWWGDDVQAAAPDAMPSCLARCTVFLASGQLSSQQACRRTRVLQKPAQLAIFSACAVASTRIVAALLQKRQNALAPAPPALHGRSCSSPASSAAADAAEPPAAVQMRRPRQRQQHQ